MKPLKIIHYNSPVVLTFALLAFGALLLGLENTQLNTLLFSVYQAPLTNTLTWVRLFFHVLGSTSPEQYVEDMMLVLLIGPMIEEKYGSQQLLVMIVITTVLTGAASMFFFPQSALTGCGELIFMLVVLASMARMENGRIPLTTVLVIFLYLGQAIYAAVSVQSNLYQMTQLLGGLCGCVFGLTLNRKKKPAKAPA